MVDFFRYLVQDIAEVLPNFSCTISDNDEYLTLVYGFNGKTIENTAISKRMRREDILKHFITEISDYVCDSEPNGLIIVPKVECEYKVTDPFFDNLDECSGGYYPSYSSKECIILISRVAKDLSAVGMLRIEKRNLKGGAFIRLYNKNSDIRITIRLGSIENNPVLILRFGDYKNFNVITQVLDGTKANKVSNFMAVELINSIIPKMVSLSHDLMLKRYEIYLESIVWVDNLMKEFGIRKPKEQKKLPLKDQGEQ